MQPALLVSLSISTWSARVTDEGATDEVLTRNEAAPKAAEVKKVLLKKEAFKAIRTLINQVRRYHYTHTLPYQDGVSILLGSAFPAYEKAMDEFRPQFQRLVDGFIDGLDGYKEEARKVLGHLYNEKDYPTSTALREEFAFSWKIMPFPITAQLHELGSVLAEEEIERVRRACDDNMAAAVRQAMADVWRRLMEPVTSMATRLADPEGVFKDALVENVRSIAATLPALNLTGDPELEAIRRQVEAQLTTLDADALRHSPVLRADQARKAAAISATLADVGRRKFNLTPSPSEQP